MNYTVERLRELDEADIERLRQESEKEGYRFLSRLVQEYMDGSNRFEAPGEALFCVLDEDGNIVGVGGLNRSPYNPNGHVARLRRFYVLSDARRNGVGSLLLKAILHHAAPHFDEITLRTESSKADAFYRANGFACDESESETTHIYRLKKEH
ncbi:GNAT family N-acetyltransferase [Sporosarcina sp. Te-1]|uniref:GNAT family N-acetyltransferase n=1 Tax=Sporosarcina sp. Te-1 TaxID=2818390 RepID=UPI001A9F7915|nr:GNAT family N-acetyltransferase [Sporosarcina sp. Te-1]QTD42573.1 GNAT family N-acetyltransferase [Sporosarcina sp. Te-1]